MEKEINLEADLKRLLTCIELESDEERRRFMAKDSQALKALRANGLALFPIRINNKRFGLADYPEVSFSLPFNGEYNAFKDGSLIEVFCTDEEPIKAVLLYLSGGKGELRMFAPDFPDWIEDRGVGIKLIPDQRTTSKMTDAINAISADKNLLQLFAGTRSKIDTHQQHHHKITSWENKLLNASQQQTIETLVESDSKISIIHGPPGTGKTTTLAELIHQCALLSKRILVAAPSNTAVDNLAKKLIKYYPKLNILRIGNQTKVDEEVYPHTPEGRFVTSKAFKEIKRLKIKAEEFRKMANTYKRNFGKQEREQRNLLFKEVKQIRSDIKRTERQHFDQLFEHAQVILGTPIGLSDINFDELVDLLLIDEAGQCLEPLAWCIIPFAKRTILCGDHLQLPPTVLSEEAKRMGFNISILEQCFTSVKQANLLDTQYRMHDKIISFPNSFFYEGKLKSTTNHEDTPQNMLFYDTAGTGFEENYDAEQNSLTNVGEIELIQKVIDQFQFKPEFTAIISPYSAQVNLLKSSFSGFRCSTIDSFQGQEQDNIIISMVRSNDEGLIGFLSDYRRMNVAMTRAKCSLIMIGDSATLGNDTFYQKLISHCETTDSYRSAFELLYT